MIKQAILYVVLILALSGCASDDAPVEMITAADIHEIEGASAEANEEPSEPVTVEELESHPETNTDWIALDSTSDDQDTSAVISEDQRSEDVLSSITEEDPLSLSGGTTLVGIYRVKRGDSLSKIATKIYKDKSMWNMLAAENKLGGKYRIYPGQLLRFATLNRHADEYFTRLQSVATARIKVKRGDSLSKIAKRIYKNPANWQVLYSLNKDKLSSPEKVYAGMTLNYVKLSDFNEIASVPVPDAIANGLVMSDSGHQK